MNSVKFGPTQLEVLRKARPYIRAGAAFVIYLRYGPWDKVLDPLGSIFETADKFLDQLDEDVEAASKDRH